MLWLILALLLLAYLIIGEFIAVVNRVEGRWVREYLSLYRIRSGRLDVDTDVGTYLKQAVFQAERNERLAFLWPYLIYLLVKERKNG